MQTSKFLVRASMQVTKQASLPFSRTFASSSIAMQRVSELIKHDHDELRTYKDNILRATTDDEKVRWQNQFTWELARHSIAEELVVYPAMERNCPGGEALANKDRAEHRKVKELLYKFQKLNPDVEDFEPTLKALWSELEHHIKEEESEDLPHLEKHTPTDESANLAASFNRTKAFVPSRSHPSAPDDGGPFETVAGLMAAPMDRIGDMFRKFPKTR
ncbi:hemerythrin HHE cation binding domain protein [Aureobasidium sp. EXF-10727]|nr:hemerythrin HHE cation binding domain protein [Aureobasidium sp. EXF-10727]